MVLVAYSNVLDRRGSDVLLSGRIKDSCLVAWYKNKREHILVGSDCGDG